MVTKPTPKRPAKRKSPQRAEQKASPPSPGETRGNLAARSRWFTKRRETSR